MEWGSPFALGYGLLVGALLHSPPAVLMRAANLAAVDFGINALSFLTPALTPALTLLWLFFFSEVGVERPDYLLIGLFLTVAVNVLIHFREAGLVALGTLVRRAVG